MVCSVPRRSGPFSPVLSDSGDVPNIAGREEKGKHLENGGRGGRAGREMKQMMMMMVAERVDNKLWWQLF